jgi:D-alanyl-D-alanine carboxypeptidase
VLGALLTALAAGLAPAPAAAPSPLHRPDPSPLVETARKVPFTPRLGAASWIAIDAGSGRILFGYHDRARRPIASLTKVMTGMLAIEAGGLAKKALVTRGATLVEPNRDELVAGHRYRRRTLLYSALLASNNDAAYALGRDVFGTLPALYRHMNAAAAALGMVDTRYASPNGLDDAHNWSTARDQAILARYALGDPLFAKVVGTRYYRTRWAAPTFVKEYMNHNRMLFDYPGSIGVKTGWTSVAQGCLIEAAHRDGHTVIAVVLGSKNVWNDMPRVLDEAFRLERASA